MSVVLLASPGGSPGVTTCALALALTWPREVLLADCDRHPSQSLLAGYLNGLGVHGSGLAGFAESARARELRDGYLRTESLVIPNARSRALFFPGFSHPSAASIFTPLWGQFADQLTVLSSLGVDVLIDVGRLWAEPIASPLISLASQVLLVVRSSLRSLAATRLWLPTLQEQLAAVDQTLPVGLVLVGAGRPYSGREIAAQFGLPVTGEISWQPNDAAVLSDGETARAGFLRRPLIRSAHQLAEALYSQLARRAETHQMPPGQMSSGHIPPGQVAR